MRLNLSLKGLCNVTLIENPRTFRCDCIKSLVVIRQREDVIFTNRLFSGEKTFSAFCLGIKDEPACQFQPGSQGHVCRNAFSGHLNGRCHDFFPWHMAVVLPRCFQRPQHSRYGNRSMPDIDCYTITVRHNDLSPGMCVYAGYPGHGIRPVNDDRFLTGWFDCDEGAATEAAHQDLGQACS